MREPASHLLFGRPLKGAGPPKPIEPADPDDLFDRPNCGIYGLRSAVYLERAEDLPQRDLYFQNKRFTKLITVLDGPIAFDKDDNRFQVHVGIDCLPTDKDGITHESSYVVIVQNEQRNKPKVQVTFFPTISKALRHANGCVQLAFDAYDGFEFTTTPYELTLDHWHQAFRWHPNAPAGTSFPPHLNEDISDPAKDLLLDESHLPVIITS